MFCTLASPVFTVSIGCWRGCHLVVAPFVPLCPRHEAQHAASGSRAGLRTGSHSAGTLGNPTCHPTCACALDRSGKVLALAGRCEPLTGARCCDIPARCLSSCDL